MVNKMRLRLRWKTAHPGEFNFQIGWHFVSLYAGYCKPSQKQSPFQPFRVPFCSQTIQREIELRKIQ